MAWQYDTSLLSTDKTTQVRFLIGDTVAGDPQLQNEEIAFALTIRSTIYGAAAECCRSISANKSRLSDSVQGELRTLYSSQARAYSQRAMEFEGKSALSGGGIPYAGGISIADKQNREADSDRVPPQFNIGMDDDTLPVAPIGNETLEPPSSPVS